MVYEVRLSRFDALRFAPYQLLWTLGKMLPPMTMAFQVHEGRLRVNWKQKPDPRAAALRDYSQVGKYAGKAMLLLLLLLLLQAQSASTISRTGLTS
jgi:hypothetical protein